MKMLLFVTVLGLGACKSNGLNGSADLSPPPSGTVRLTVSATSTVSGIDHLAVTVEAGGAKTTIQLFAPAAIPPSVTFDLQVVAGYSATVTVQAVGATGNIVGSGSGATEAATDHAVDLTVTLQPA
jgi:hypothetical protein